MLGGIHWEIGISRGLIWKIFGECISVQEIDANHGNFALYDRVVDP